MPEAPNRQSEVAGEDTRTVGRVALALAVVGLGVLLTVGMDGDDYFVLTQCRRLPPGEFLGLFWPVQNISYRFLVFALPWGLSWVCDQPDRALIVLGSILFVPKFWMLYVCTRWVLGSARQALLLALLASLAFFPFPWVYRTGHARLWLLLSLWCWMRWWDTGQRKHLLAFMLADTVGLFTYELQLMVPVLCYCAAVIRNGAPAFRQLCGPRFRASVVFALPTLLYASVRFGVLGQYHYYASVPDELTGATAGPLWGVTSAVLRTLTDAWGAALAFGFPPPGSWLVPTVILGAITLAVVRHWSAVRSRLVQGCAAAAFATALLLPLTGVFKLTGGLYFATWGLGLVLLTLLQPVRGVRVEAAMLALVLFEAGNAVGRVRAVGQRAAAQREFARELQRAVPTDKGPAYVLVRDMPAFAPGGWPMGTTADSLGRGLLPWPQAGDVRVASWGGEVPNVPHWIFQWLEPPQRSAWPLALFVWEKGRLLPDPMAAHVLPLASRPREWAAEQDAGFRAWQGNISLRRLPNERGVWRATDATVTLSGPLMPASKERFRSVFLRIQLTARRPGTAVVRVFGETVAIADTTLWPSLTCWVPLDGAWHDVWLPLNSNPQFGMFRPVRRLHVRVEGQRDMVLAFERIALVP